MEKPVLWGTLMESVIPLLHEKGMERSKPPQQERARSTLQGRVTKDHSAPEGKGTDEASPSLKETLTE